MKSSKIKGLWWLARKTKERWLGNLHIKEANSLRLKLTILEGYSSKLPETPTVIHGINSSNKAITLLFPSRSRISQSAVFTEYQYTAGYGIFGFHLKDVESLRLNKVTLQMQYLHDWMNRTGFKRSQKRSKKFTVEYERPEILSHKIDANFCIESHTWCKTHDGGRAYEISEFTDLRFRFRKAAGLKDILDIVSSIRGLLHFSILRPVHLVTLQGNKNKHGTKYPEVFLPEDVEIVSGLNKKDVTRYTHSNEFVFSYSDISETFSDFVRTWLQYSKTYENPLGCYYTTIYHKQTTIEQHLSLTRALDSYYGVKYNQRDLNDFPKKVRELITRHHGNLIKWVPNIDDFVETVKINRHFYTHFGSRMEATQKVVSGAKLIQLNVVLRILFQMCVLDDIKIPVSRFNRLYRQFPSRIVDYAI